MTLRLIKITLLSIWWGAFTFYAGIVVPVGMKVLGSHTQMGFITQEVAQYLNFLSIVIFVSYSYCLKKTPTQRHSLVQEILMVTLLGFQLILFLLHYYLTDLLDFDKQIIYNSALFYLLHRIYLIVETIIWLTVSGLIIKNLFEKDLD
jgi:hypothetical protein